MKTSKYIVALVCMICVCVFCVISVTGEIFTLTELPVNFMAAFLGAIVTAIITLFLLKGQTEAEEVKEKNVKVFEKKAQLFEEFNTKLLDITINQKIEANDYINIKTEYYSKLMLYLNEKAQQKIISYLKKLGDCVGVSFNAGIYNFTEINNCYESIRKNIYNIINVLTEDIGSNGKINIDAQRELDITVFPRLFKEILLNEFDKMFSNEKIFNKARYQKMANGTFLVLNLNGNFTIGGGIHVGPFFNYPANENFPAYDGIFFRFFAPPLNPVSELYNVKDGTNINIHHVDFKNSQSGLICLKEPLLPSAFKKINIDSNIYNEELSIIRFDDVSTIIAYSSIYKSISESIAARAFFHYKTAETRNEGITIEKLFEKFENITIEQCCECLIEKITTPTDSSK